MAEEQSTLAARVSFLVPLNKLPADRQTRLLDQSELIKLRKKQTLFKQGDRDDFTYYLIDGDMEMYADDSLIKRLTGGDGASFQPLAQLQPRQMSAIAKSASQVLQVRRSLLDQLLSMDEDDSESEIATGVEVQEMEADQGGDWLMTLLQSELFTRIPPSNIQGLLDTLETVNVEAGDVVIRQGEQGDYYYAIQSGACEVVRSGANKREIKLAELVAGATFGEEALISGAKRNATVRMTRAGELARLTKEDFTRLVKAPLLSSMKRAQAEQKIAEGAVWLDVRFEDEHQHNGIAGSINIPHGTLRKRMSELDPDLTYVAYCDSGGRSSAAAFLLAEKGFDVSFVEGGAVTEPVAEKPAQSVAAEKKPAAVADASSPAPMPEPVANDAPAVETPASGNDGDSVLEANALASSLKAEAEKAQLTIDKAMAMMAEAQAMKLEADRVVSDKLASERKLLDAQTARLQEKLAEAEAVKRNAERDAAERLAAERARIDTEAVRIQEKLAEAEATRREADRVVQAKLAAERVRIDAETAQLKEKLADAQRLKESLTKRHQAAEEEASRCENEVEQRLVVLEREASERLHEEQQRLEALYQKQTEQLESMQADREVELRDKLSAELAAERSKFEQGVVRATEELERAKEERRQAIAAKEAATAEAQSTIAEFKAQHVRLQAEQRAALDLERQRISAEAARIERLTEEVTKAREAAEAAKAEAERELEAARSRQAAQPATADVLAIVEIEARASAAGVDLMHALEAESEAVSAARENEHELERTYDTAAEINELLEKELSDFAAGQKELDGSELQREVLSRQKEMVARIKARAKQMQQESKDKDQGLLDEIASQLGKH